MRRRALLATTATAIATPLVTGCTRDDGGGDGEGGDENQGAGGMYGMIGTGGTLAVGEPSDDVVCGPDSRRPAGPALGPADPACDD